MFARSIQGWGSDAGHIAQHLALATETTVGGLSFQAESFPQGLVGKVISALDHFDHALGAKTIAETVELLPDTLVDFNTIQSRHLAQVCVPVSYTHLTLPTKRIV